MFQLATAEGNPAPGRCKPEENWYIFGAALFSLTAIAVGAVAFESHAREFAPRIPIPINNRFHRSSFGCRRFALMQGPFLGTKSASTRLALAVSFLIVLTLLIVGALPLTSSATQEKAQSGGSEKQSRPEFVPGEALVRYRSERVAKRQTLQTLVSADGRQLSIQLERFEGSDIVPGLRLAHVAAADTMAAIEALKKQPDVLYAEPNYLLHLDVTPNDPRFTSGELIWPHENRRANSLGHYDRDNRQQPDCCRRD